MDDVVPNCPVEGRAEVARRIKVRVEMSENGPCWNYAIEADDQASDPYVKPGNKIDVPHGAQATIEFRLQGKLGKRLDFKTSDPIWVDENGCPTGPGDGGGEIQLIRCTDERLELLDLNSNSAELHYRLNFFDRHGNELCWDPIIRNGGGGP